MEGRRVDGWVSEWVSGGRRVNNTTTTTFQQQQHFNNNNISTTTTFQQQQHFNNNNPPSVIFLAISLSTSSITMTGKEILRTAIHSGTFSGVIWKTVCEGARGRGVEKGWGKEGVWEGGLKRVGGKKGCGKGG